MRWGEIAKGDRWEAYSAGLARFTGGDVERPVTTVQGLAEEPPDGLAAQRVGTLDTGFDILVGVGGPIGQTMM